MVFVIKSQYDEYELPLKTWNSRILLETLKEQLEMHKPPLRPKSVNNVPISVRHDDKTLQVQLHNGQRLEVEAEILPGKVCACGHVSCTKAADHLGYCICKHMLSVAGFQPFTAYPQSFLTKRLLSSWINT